MKKAPSHVIRVVCSALLASTALFLIPVVAQADPAAEDTAAPDVVSSAAPPQGEHRYIVRYGDHVNSEAESASLEQQGIDVKETLTHAIKASVVVATPGQIEELKNSDDVATVELDTPVSVFGATSLWNLDRIDQRSGRDGQYSIGDEGAGVHIYVVDTGVSTSHTDFAGRVPTGWTRINDGRGYQDCGGHGTHVAGTAAGTTYGVAKKAAIIPVRVLECNGSGWSSDVMLGIDWAISHHLAGQPAVMNLSVGGFTNSSFDETVQRAVNDGITVVAAAGNSGVDACGASPARVPSAITVAATNINDEQVSWSNYGSCVDVQAPGFGIRSAWINAPTGYNTLDGTSMAVPHVSGAAAILLSRDWSLTPAQVHQAVIQNATTGVISYNKGATPNRLLFIPDPVPALPSCSQLKLGDAWAGVGMRCSVQGTTGTAASPEVLAAPDEAPAATAVEVPVEAPGQAPVSAPEEAPGQAPASTPEVSAPVEKAPASTPEVAAPSEERPAPAQDAAEPAPVAAPVVPAPSQPQPPSPESARQESESEPVTSSALQAPAANLAGSAASGSQDQDDPVAAPKEITPGDGAEDETTEVGATAALPAEGSKAGPSPALVAADAAIAASDTTKDTTTDATALKTVAQADAVAWASIAVLVLTAFMVAFAIRRRDNRNKQTAG